MPPCEYGTQIKPEFSENEVWITATDAFAEMAGFLPLVGQYIEPLLPQIYPRLWDLNLMCSTPAPVVPEYDFGELFRSGQWASIPQTFVDWFWAQWQNWRWNHYCECKVGSGVPCPTNTYTLTNFILQKAQTVIVMSNQIPPAGTNRIKLKWTVDCVLGSGTPSAHMVRRLPNSHADTIRTSLDFMVAPQTKVYETTFNVCGDDPHYPTACYNQITAGLFRVNPDAGTSQPRFNCTVDVTWENESCGASLPPTPFTPGPAPGCDECPPPPPAPPSCTDDELCERVKSIQSTLLHVSQLVSVIQRYDVPLRTTPGTVHGPFSGAGAFVVTAIAGIRVDITSPAPSKQLEGNPPYLWDQGWLTIARDDEFIDEKRLTRDPQIWQPRLMQEATSFQYYLKPGCTATFTELWPEPY